MAPVQAVNRNGLFRADGSRFIPRPNSVYTINAKYAIEPDVVPKPRSSQLSPSMLAMFFYIKLFGKRGCPIGKNERIVKIEEYMIDTVIPKTWTDPT